MEIVTHHCHRYHHHHLIIPFHHHQFINLVINPTIIIYRYYLVPATCLPLQALPYTVKKVINFPAPARMSLTNLSLAGKSLTFFTV
jgi:hypothetical protein